MFPSSTELTPFVKPLCGCKRRVLRCGRHLLRRSRLQLNEIALWVFGRGILGVRLVVEREILAVFLFHLLHFLVSIRLFPPVHESGCYSRAGHDHKDDHGYDTCKAEDGIRVREVFGSVSNRILLLVLFFVVHFAHYAYCLKSSSSVAHLLEMTCR